MAKTEGKKEKRSKLVYKSQEARRVIQISPELHRILKLESTVKGKTIKEIMEESIRNYLKL